MKKYRISPYEFIIYVLTRGLLMLPVAYLMRLFLQRQFQISYKYLDILITLIPFVLAGVLLLRHALYVKFDDEKFQIVRRNVIYKYRFSQYYVTCLNTKTYILGVIPVYNSREIHIVDKENGEDEIFRAHGFSMKKYHDIKEGLKDIQHKGGKYGNN